MTNEYDYMFKWIKNSTREDHHIAEIENFAKENHKLFMDFHQLTKPITQFDENTSEYIDAKKKITALFDENKETFEPFFHAIKTNFAGKYF